MTNDSSLARGLRIISLLAGDPIGLPLSELSYRLDIPKSSCHRLLQILLEGGYVSQGPNSLNYRLTLKLLWTVTEQLDSLGLEQMVQPALVKLSQATSETIHMALLDGNTAVYIAKIDSPGAIRMHSRVGRRLSLHSTGLGKAMLAYLPQATINEILNSGGMPRRTPHTIVDRESLMLELSDIRNQQFAFDREENEEGIHCIAMPLFDQKSQVVGALSIAALKFRTSEEQLVSWLPELRSCSREVTKALRLYHPGR